MARMAPVVDLVLVGAVVALHTLLAAVATRFFRIHMQTRWGTVLYASMAVPFVLVVTTMVFAGVLNVGAGLDLGSQVAVLALFVALPAVLGATIDVLYMAPPEAASLPDPRRS